MCRKKRRTQRYRPIYRVARELGEKRMKFRTFVLSVRADLYGILANDRHSVHIQRKRKQTLKTVISRVNTQPSNHMFHSTCCTTSPPLSVLAMYRSTSNDRVDTLVRNSNSCVRVSTNDVFVVLLDCLFTALHL